MLKLPQDTLGKLREYIREYGLREAAERSFVWIAGHVAPSSVHRKSTPRLADFADAAASMHFSAGEMVETCLLSGQTQSELLQLQSEYDALCREVDRRYVERSWTYAQAYAVEQGSAFLLYAIVRLRRPRVVLETGVANGHSSFFILNAMRANGHGILHSVDRFSDVGGLLDDRERELWHLHIIKATDLKGNFLEIVSSLPPVDFFLHDSDHTYAWQFYELHEMVRRLAPGAILASDDCDCNYSFLDVCQMACVKPMILVEKRKVFGIVLLKQPLRAVPDGTDNPTDIRNESPFATSGRRS